MGLRFHGGYSGLLVEAENLKNLSFLGGWQDPKAKALLYGQSASLMFYYLCENAAYVYYSSAIDTDYLFRVQGGVCSVQHSSPLRWCCCYNAACICYCHGVHGS